MQRSLLRSLGIALFLSIALAPIKSNAIDSIVVFNEINYHPAENNHLLEFIEIYNQNSVNVDLTGWKLTGGVDYSFSKNTIIEGGSYMVIALDPETIKEVSGLAQVLGPYEGRLDNAGETIRLRNNNGRIMDQITYNDKDPWPKSTDGKGSSLIRIDPAGDGDPNMPSQWRPSIKKGGNPGTSDSMTFRGEGPLDLLAYAISETDKISALINEDGNPIINVRQRLGADDALIELEKSINGITWIPLTEGNELELIGRTHKSDGTESLKYIITSGNPVNPEPSVFFRAKVRLR